MKPFGSAIEHDEILSHDAWIRRLARALVGDPGEAEDAAQEVWASALGCPAKHRSHPRAWVTKILRNAVRQRIRSRSRRESREHQVARSEALPDTFELVRRGECGRRIAEALRSLSEAQRAVLTLRFFEDLPPRDIAKRLGMPVDTVRTHLQRGLARMRRRLEREYGDARAWLPLPFALRLPGPTPAAATASSLMLTLSLGVGLLVGWTWLLSADDRMRTLSAPEGPTMRVASIPTRAAAPPRANFDASGRPGHAGRIASPSQSTPTEFGSDAAPELGRGLALEGHVFDERGVPVPEVEVEWYREDRAWIVRHEDCSVQMLSTPPEGPLAETTPAGLDSMRVTTDAEGAFAMRVPAHGSMRLTDENWMTLAAGWRRVGTGQEPVLVAARVRECRGVVRDPCGAPLLGARVRVSHRLESLARFPFALRGSEVQGSSAATDVRGDFVLERVPAISSLTLQVSCDGFLDRRVVVSSPGQGAAGSELDLRLEPVPEDENTRLVGTVVDARGVPVVGARVYWAGRMVRSEAEGAFAMFAASPCDAARLFALGPDGEFAWVTLATGATSGGREAPESIAVQLSSRKTRTLSGRVVTERGEPAERARVTLLEGTSLEGFDRTAEELAAQLDPERPVETDREGAFRLEGLLGESYRLRVWNSQGAMLLTQSIEVGEGELILTLPSAGVDTDIHIEGRVVNAHSQPVGFASVHLGFETASGSFHPLRGTLTDANGRFRLPDVPVLPLFLSVQGPGLRRTDFHGPGLFSGEEQRLQVAPFCRLQVRLEALSAADVDACILRNAEGEPVDFLEAAAGDLAVRQIAPDSKGFPLCLAPEEACELVLLLRGVEVASRRVELSPDRLTVVRF